MFYKCPMLGSQKLALQAWLNHAALIKSLNRCCFSGWKGNSHVLTLGRSNCTVFWMCIFTVWNVFIIHGGRKVARGVVLPSPPVRNWKAAIYIFEVQLLSNDVSTGAFSCQTLRGGDATLVSHLGLAQGDTGSGRIALFPQECSRGNKILLSGFSSRSGESFLTSVIT